MALDIDYDSLRETLRSAFDAWIDVNGLLFQGLGIAAAVLVVAVTLSRDARVRRAEELAYRKRQANRIRWEHEYSGRGPRITVTNGSDEPIFDLVVSYATILRRGGDFDPAGQSENPPENWLAFLGVDQSAHFYGSWTTHKITPAENEADCVYPDMEWNDPTSTGWTTKGAYGAVALRRRRERIRPPGWIIDPQS